jgi:hypothetical protein
VDRRLQAEPVFGVVEHARLVAVAEFRVDLVVDRVLPVEQGTARHPRAADHDAGFLADFAHRRVGERLVEPVLRTRHRLPERGMIGAFEQQHVERGRMDDDEDGLRNFRRFRHGSIRGATRRAVHVG